MLKDKENRRGPFQYHCFKCGKPRHTSRRCCIAFDSLGCENGDAHGMSISQVTARTLIQRVVAMPGRDSATAGTVACIVPAPVRRSVGVSWVGNSGGGG